MCFLMKKKKNTVSSAWINATIKKINEVEPVENGIKYSLRGGDETLLSRYSFWDYTIRTKTFQETLLDKINEQGITYRQFYLRAHLDRKLFSAIKNNPQYQPRKETAVACCFGLKMGTREAEALLSSAGYRLSLSITFDRVVYYCLNNDITDIDVVNELLYETGAKCIGA